jgi:hypothetical protein
MLLVRADSMRHPIRLLASLLLLGCSPAEPPTSDAIELAPEAGFVDVAADSYTIDGTPLVASPARLFYSFHPATIAPDRAPLLVLGAGGPEASVLFLLATGTSEQRIEAGRLVPNPDSLTDVAHLLYLDARQAGFSYGTLPDPASRAARDAELSAANYNPYRDAADFIQGLLAFLAEHPALDDHGVVLVGESYGGLRTSVMLNLLLFAPEYAAGTRRFASPALSARIREYFTARFGTTDPDPAEVATAFRGQILLEPWFAGTRQSELEGPLLEAPGSILDEVAAETGTPYLRCAEQPAPCVPYDNAVTFLAAAGRSAFDVRAPDDWLARHDAAVTAVAANPAALSAVLGVPEADLAAGLPVDRGDAYRFADPAAHTGILGAAWGDLPAWDDYFVSNHDEARQAFFGSDADALGVNPGLPSHGELTIENLRFVPTFVSRATYDVVVYAPALVPTLASYPSVSSVTERGDREIVVRFADGTERTLVAPRYASSHAVESDEPAALHDDLAAFLTLVAP